MSVVVFYALVIIMGLLLAIFGYFICIKNRYDLVNGYVPSEEGDRAALRVGRVELGAGTAFVVAGVAMFFVSFWVAVVGFCLLLLALIICLSAAGRGL